MIPFINVVTFSSEASHVTRSVMTVKSPSIINGMASKSADMTPSTPSIMTGTS